jgi:peptide/nickel transport system ATP-binding protein
VLEGVGITVGYPGRPSVVRDLSLSLAAGQVTGMAGPSGCGKSTLARALALLHPLETGHVCVDGKPVYGYGYGAPPSLRTRVAIVFQQPRLSVDPRLRLFDIIAEPLRATGRAQEAASRVAALAGETGLTDDLLRRRPHEVSDGQLQRACLARALVLRPGYLICDEMTSMLDASTTAALVGVVEAHRCAGLGVLAISHDEDLLKRWCAASSGPIHTLGNAGLASTSLPKEIESC